MTSDVVFARLVGGPFDGDEAWMDEVHHDDVPPHLWARPCPRRSPGCVSHWYTTDRFGGDRYDLEEFSDRDPQRPTATYVYADLDDAGGPRRVEQRELVPA